MSITDPALVAGTAQQAVGEPCVLLKLGEVVLKGRNRQQFERLLQNNIRLAIGDLGIGIKLWQRDGVIVLNPVAPASATAGPASWSAKAAEDAADAIARRMLTVMGVVRVCRAVRVAKDPPAAIDAAARFAEGQPGSFAVRAKRRDKRFPLTSAEQLTYNEWVAAAAHSLGMAVLQKNDGEQTPELLSYFDGALSEQCNQYSECADFRAYLAAGKPVLNAEYRLATRRFCAADDAAGIMGARYNLALNGKRFEPCF